MQWTLKEKKTVFSCRPFAVEQLSLEDRSAEKVCHEFYRIHAPDWVNIIPVLADGRVLLIRQSRPGSMTEILETPGGMMDKAEKDPTMAALRELEEETGFTSQRIVPLASINPNPAIMDNKLHYFIALGCQPNPQRKHFPDEHEQIECVLVEAKKLDFMVRTGQINHSLSALGIMLAGKYIKISEEA